MRDRIIVLAQEDNEPSAGTDTGVQCGPRVATHGVDPPVARSGTTRPEDPTMAPKRPRDRLAAIALATLIMATSAVDLGHGTTTVLAAGASAAPAPAVGSVESVDLRLPDSDDLVTDADLPVVDEPEAAGEQSLDDVLATTYAAAQSLPLSEWDTGALAASLGTDPAAAFAFVRDFIRFEPYPGVLRGADGTLAARSANASDRALLLHDLLDAMGVTSRVAFGDVTPEVAGLLVDHAFDRPAAPLSDPADLRLAGLDGAAIQQRARRDYALLRRALGDRVDAMAPVSIQGALADVVHHTWVQVEESGVWVDYDPSLAGAEPGQALAVAARTADEMPAEQHQRVTIRVISETLHPDGVYEELLLERLMSAADAADTATFLYFQPNADSSGLGPLGNVGAATSYVPVLLVDADGQQGLPFPIGNGDGGGGGFGGLGGGGGGAALLSLRLSVTREVPGQAPRESTRTLVDRVPQAARAAGSVDVSTLPPLPVGPGGPLVFGMLHQVLVSTGGADPRLQAIDRGLAASWVAEELLVDNGVEGYALSDLLLPVAVANEALVVASERGIVPEVDAIDGLLSFVGRPRVFVASMGPGSGGPDSIMFETDLLVDGISTIVRKGSDPAAAPASQLWYGVLQSALETEFGRGLARTLRAEGRRSIGVSQVMDQSLTVVGFNEFGMLATASPALVAAVSAGQLGVVPGEPATARAWWAVDPATGAARAVIDPGLGGQFYEGGGTRPTLPDRGTSSTIPDYDKAKRAKKILQARMNGKCKRGNEYLLVLGCVSIPVYWAIVSTFLVILLTAVAVGILFAIRGITRIGGRADPPLPRDRLLERKPA